MKSTTLKKQQDNHSGSYWRRVRRRFVSIVNKALKKNSNNGNNADTRQQETPHQNPAPSKPQSTYNYIPGETNKLVETTRAGDAGLFKTPVQAPPRITTSYSLLHTPVVSSAVSGTTTDTKCPQCSCHLDLTIDNILALKPIYCSGCGLKLSLDICQSQQGLEFLKAIKRLTSSNAEINQIHK